MNKVFDNLALIILDGWGIGQKDHTDAIHKASTPYFDKLFSTYPTSSLTTFGEEVGLPEGQMGNSEVGHLNIGAGRIVYQELARINKSIKDQELEQNAALRELIELAKSEKKKVHLLGLVSDGGVHSHINHLKALVHIFDKHGLTDTFIHAFMDGRDTSPTGGKDYLKDVLACIEDTPTKLASVIGRYYAMDRDNRWERIKKAYDLMVHGKGEQVKSSDIVSYVEKLYEQNQTDEFIEPISICSEQNNSIAQIESGDIVLFYNFRTDRPREISIALSQEDFPEQNMQKLDLHFYTMTKYSEAFKDIRVLFEKNDLQKTLGEIVSAAGKSQVRIAETEKYPHVTFFFNGGIEEPFKHEDRILIPSPKVATYDLKPEMSAFEITSSLIERVKTNAPNLIVLNYANTDMVGHTGDFDAAMQSANAVDNCLSDLIPTLLEKDYGIIIIADHGNSDFMINPDNTPNTAHTLNPVPIVFVSNETEGSIQEGKLADIAPSILNLMNIEIPEEMTGDIIINK
jgi:2,3-bisphosphoglycerate-independent phosphoglycerate mutase